MVRDKGRGRGVLEEKRGLNFLVEGGKLGGYPTEGGIFEFLWMSGGKPDSPFSEGKPGLEVPLSIPYYYSQSLSGP